MDANAVTLILNALAAGAATGGQALVSDAVKDAYAGLKTLIQRKFAGKPVAETALSEHENDPQTWQAPLRKALQQEHLDQDPEILHAAQLLLERLHKEAGGTQYRQSITGNYNAQVQGDGNASVNIQQTKDQ